ncbi:Hypothetical protein D9617_5g071390 [Elsinoe fawcettii]|nr:Hypothetical protein D9617_5g071390 [Elsinoe fawcettii]
MITVVPVNSLETIRRGLIGAQQLSNAAQLAIGSPGTGDTVWTFPHLQARDLAGKIFGAYALSPRNRYRIIKNNIDYVAQHYTTNIDLQRVPLDLSTVPVDSIIFYCDMSRYDPQSELLGEVYSTINGQDKVFTKELSKCGGLGILSRGATTEAYTKPQGPEGFRNYALVQLCPWFLKSYRGAKYATAEDVPKSYSSVRIGFERLKNAFGDADMVDTIALFDHTIYHEMTHAVQNSEHDLGQDTQRAGTVDAGKNKGYGWDAVRDNSGAVTGYYNAGSY